MSMIATKCEFDAVEVASLPQYASLFPLPLSPFERYLLHDERADYPMTFFVEMVFVGAMQPEALVESVRDAAARHPLLLARVERVRQGWCWVLPATARIPIDYQPSESSYAPPRGKAIDLANESGLRVWVREDGERTSVSLQIHHACCDGEGSRRFGFDLMTGYARRTGSHCAPEWTRVEYARLRERAQFGASLGAVEPVRTSVWDKLRHAWHFHVLGPSPLAAGRNSPAQPEGDSPVMIKHVFSRSETQHLKQRAADSEGVLNDAAIAMLFQTLAQWNSRREQTSSKQRLRILMPTDLRDRGDRWLTAANRIGFSFLSRTIGQCGDFQTLLSGISQETDYIRRIRLGLDFLQGLSGVQRIPFLLPALLKLPRCMSTAVLTNLGDTTRRFRSRFPVSDGYPVIGDVQLEQVVGVPPLRPGTHAGFGICLCAGRLAISLRPDSLQLNLVDAMRLLNDYIAAWNGWAESGDGNADPLAVTDSCSFIRTKVPADELSSAGGAVRYEAPVIDSSS